LRITWLTGQFSVGQGIFALKTLTKPSIGLSGLSSYHRHKYVIDDMGRGFMLYDLENDPDEQNNLIGQKEALSLEEESRDLLLKQLLETQYVME
jgi:hypothetical protein